MFGASIPFLKLGARELSRWLSAVLRLVQCRKSDGQSIRVVIRMYVAVDAALWRPTQSTAESVCI
jgi:hypothetical protein